MNRAQKRMAVKLAKRKPAANDARYFPKPLDEFEQFDSIERLFQKLRNGEVEVEGKHIIIMGLHGETYAVLPALEGWVAYWAEVAKKFNVPYDDSTMRKLAKSLEYDKPLQPAEVEAAYLVLNQQRQMFRTIPREEIAAIAKRVTHEIRQTDEIRDRMKRRVAA